MSTFLLVEKRKYWKEPVEYIERFTCISCHIIAKLLKFSLCRTADEDKDNLPRKAAETVIRNMYMYLDDCLTPLSTEEAKSLIHDISNLWLMGEAQKSITEDRTEDRINVLKY